MRSNHYFASIFPSKIHQIGISDTTVTVTDTEIIDRKETNAEIPQNSSYSSAIDASRPFGVSFLSFPLFSHQIVLASLSCNSHSSKWNTQKRIVEIIDLCRMLDNNSDCNQSVICLKEINTRQFILM